MTDPELIALMKRICLKGYTYGKENIAPQDCWTIAEFIIERMNELNRQLDLRLLQHGFNHYLHAATGDSLLSWQDMLQARMQERASEKGITRTKQKNEEATIAKEIFTMTIPNDDKLKLWGEKTGLSKSAYYRARQKS